MKASAPTPLLLLVVALLATSFSGCFGGIASDWAYKMVGLRTVQKSLDGSDLRVAIIDTGIDANHSSLDHTKGTLVWKDFVNGRSHPYDDHGHGSHVAGIIVGEGADFGGRSRGFDMRGAAPRADLIIVKAIGANEKGRTEDVVAGIDFAVQQRADVICLSLGSNPSTLGIVLSNPMTSSINSAIGQGILVVASAGNYVDGAARPDDVTVPANIDAVIAVGAVGQDRRVADFSVRGSQDRNHGAFGTGLGARADPNKKPELVAPGVDIESAWSEGRYASAKGTSQAAPFVCGALALLLEKCPTLRATNTADMVSRVKASLRQNAEPLEGYRTPHDNAAGYGLLRADQVINSFASPC